MGYIEVVHRQYGSIVQNPLFHVRAKHVDIPHHFVLEAIKNEDLDTKHYSTFIHTKGLVRLKLFI